MLICIRNNYAPYIFAVVLMLVDSSAFVANAMPSAATGSPDSGAKSGLTVAQYYYQNVRPSAGYGPNRRPRNSEVPLPGSGQRIPVSAKDAAADSWTGCQNWRNRFKEPFQRCCSMSGGVRRCYDQY